MNQGVQRAKVDHLPVILTHLSDGNTKLLRIPLLSSGTKQSKATAVLNQQQFWQYRTEIVDKCCEKTASNTKAHNGTCTWLEKAVYRNLH